MDAAAAYTCTYRVLLLNSHLQQKLRLIILVNLIQIINVNLWILVPFNFPHFMYISHLVPFCDIYGFEEWMDKFYGLFLFSFCQVAVNSLEYTFFVEYYWRSEYLIQFRLESEVHLLLVPFWYQHESISVVDGQSFKSIGSLYSTQQLPKFLCILWTLPTN